MIIYHIVKLKEKTQDFTYSEITYSEMFLNFYTLKMVNSEFSHMLENACFPGSSDGTESACNKGHLGSIPVLGTFLVAQMVKRLPTKRETQVQSLGWEDLLEKEMATHSSTFARKIPWTEKPGKLQSLGSQRVGHN